MDFALIAALIVGALALVFAFYKAAWISKLDAGNDRMKEIANYIHEGSMAFLTRQYKALAVFVVALFIILALLIKIQTAICFLAGAIFSILAGYMGMQSATKANVRTANAAMQSGMTKALNVAFSGGAVMGMSVVGLGIIGVSVAYRR